MCKDCCGENHRQGLALQMPQQQMQEGLAAAQKLLLASRAQHSAEMAALKQQLAAAQQSSQQSAQQGATTSAELNQAKKVSSTQGVAQMLACASWLLVKSSLG